MRPTTIISGAGRVSAFLILVSSYESRVFTKFEFFILNAEGEKVKNSAGEKFAVFSKSVSHGVPVVSRDDLIKIKTEN